jgi:hypothetical protein
LQGKYQNIEMGVTEGACGTVLIHCDGTQTEEKKQKERERQRNGETPAEANVGNRFLAGMDLPGVLVRTSKSGSMTQEIFFDFCAHFIGSLPDDHDPVILFLDGHASRWNTQALKYLHDNKVFVFFFASHTSIWAQPNDCGLNKRVHWAIEQACKQYRRSGRKTTYEYFNQIFAMGWRIFLKTEADDLLETFTNNATRAYWKTGVYPLNPFAEAWKDAINSLGAANEEYKKISFEIFPAQDKLPALNPEEKQLLRTNIDITDRNDLGDFYVAEIQGTKILAKWREHIAKGVSEGNDEVLYAATSSPASLARTDFEKFAMKLIKFVAVDISKLPLPTQKTTEERAREISKTIVDLTPIARPIHISYLPESTDNTGPVDSSSAAWQKGTAVKGKNSIWNVMLQNGDQFNFNSDQMLSSSNLNIEKAYTELGSTEKKRTISLKMRLRASEMKSKENEYIVLARAKQREQEYEEFEHLKERMMMQESESSYSFEDFRGLVDRMRAPFSTDFDTPDGTRVNVRVTADDAAVMLDAAALEAMNKVLVTGGSKKRDGDDNAGAQRPPQKRRNTAAADTGLGLGCNKAFYDCDRRDRTQNENAEATKLKQNLAEKDSILATLTLVERRKKSYEVALKAWRNKAESALPGSVVGCLGVPPFWMCRKSDTDAYRMFLRMFLPKYGWGYLGKSNELQWAAIQEKIVDEVDLTASSVLAKEEQLRRRLRTLEQAIQESQQAHDQA